MFFYKWPRNVVFSGPLILLWTLNMEEIRFSYASMISTGPYEVTLEKSPQRFTVLGFLVLEFNVLSSAFGNISCRILNAFKNVSADTAVAISRVVSRGFASNNPSGSPRVHIPLSAQFGIIRYHKDGTHGDCKDLSEHSNRNGTTVVQRMEPWSRTKGLRIGINMETCWKQVGFLVGH